jgi:hypothetical protein
MFGSLRNLSVSTKEMVHRIYKEATVKTNKINLLRDLMVYENDMQALRFLGENIRDQHEMQNSELAELFSAGFFGSLYLESHEELFARGCLSGMRKLESNAASGDDDFVGVQVHGEPLNMARVTALMPGLQGNRLNDKQMGELFKVYDSIGIHQIQTNPAVTFFGSVTYWVRGRASTPQIGEDGNQDNNGKMRCPDSHDGEHRRVRVSTGDIVEFLDDSSEAYYGRGFARISGIMAHEDMVFFVLTWLISTGRIHPRLQLPEFREMALFEYAAFHPLSIVDHSRFVNNVHFISLEGSLWLDSWVFQMV